MKPSCRLLALAALAQAFLANLARAEFTIATANLEWFFDENSADDPSNIGPQFKAPDDAEYKSRVKGVSALIAELHPSIMALEEIENGKVIADLADELQDEHNLSYNVAFVQGKDTHTGQDVAFLVDSALQFAVKRFAFNTFAGDATHKELSKHAALELTIDGKPLTVVAVHLITTQAPRLRQAKTLRAWTQQIALHGGLVILGDFNSGVRFNETTPASDMGVIRGFGTSSQDDDLFDCHQLLDGQSRRTHVSGRELDRILVSRALEATAASSHRGLVIRGDEDDTPAVEYPLSESEQDLSDHFPLVAKLKWAASGDDDDDGDDEPPSDDVSARLEAIERQLAELMEEVGRLRERIDEE